MVDIDGDVTVSHRRKDLRIFSGSDGGCRTGMKMPLAAHGYDPAEEPMKTENEIRKQVGDFLICIKVSLRQLTPHVCIPVC